MRRYIQAAMVLAGSIWAAGTQAGGRGDWYDWDRNWGARWERGPRYYAPPPLAWAYRPLPPPVVLVPRPPVATYSLPAPQFSYWCDDPVGYYPTVPHCNGPWREVFPHGTK